MTPTPLAMGIWPTGAFSYNARFDVFFGVQEAVPSPTCFDFECNI